MNALSALSAPAAPQPSSSSSSSSSSSLPSSLLFVDTASISDSDSCSSNGNGNDDDGADDTEWDASASTSASESAGSDSERSGKSGRRGYEKATATLQRIQQRHHHSHHLHHVDAAKDGLKAKAKRSSKPTTPVSAAYAMVGVWAKGLLPRLLASASDADFDDASDDAADSSDAIDDAGDDTGDGTRRSPPTRICHPCPLSHLPPELLHQIFCILPSSSLAALLYTAPKISAVAVALLSSRCHYINDLDDLRAFTHDLPFLHSTPSSIIAHRRLSSQNFSLSAASSSLLRPVHPNLMYQLKQQQIGPMFYRAGTMILFARHFTRLIPEARVLLGVGYAMVLAWFMCLFYLFPFLGALTLYFAMDVVDLVCRSAFQLFYSLPLFLLATILPKTHYLHPSQPPREPRIPGLLIRRLKFTAATAPLIADQTEPQRCCGLAGTGWDNHYETTPTPTDTTITGKPAHPSPLSQLSSLPVAAATTATATAATGGLLATQKTATAPFWGLMSPYTPWHLYLLTHTLATHEEITHLTLSRISLAWWFRLHPVSQLRVLVLQTCEMDETGIGLVAKAFEGVRGVVLRGSEVRCGGWDVESIRRGSSSASPSHSGGGDSDEGDSGNGGSDDDDYEESDEKGWWGKRSASTTEAVTMKATSENSTVSLFKSVRVVRFEMCATACAIDAVRMVLDRCPIVERVEFVGCGIDDEVFLEADAGGIVEFETIHDCRTESSYEENGSQGLHDSGVVVPEGIVVHNELWFEGQRNFEERIDCCIIATRRFLKERAAVAAAVLAVQQELYPSNTNLNVDSNNTINIGAEEVFNLEETESVLEDDFIPLETPAGFRKCIVVQGKSLQGLRNKWYMHVKSRQRGFWAH
ncbi:hypothetical protein HK100_009976 [Physocladia obscura]|uniref:F-box domain-containing protein n=1 Tax=Physocladia obscura TaxID=109957 RepID=A0AAD5XE00_9FUNG|nr:hypothetical protein HK100_009976 [Physocladia obscura]